VGKIVSKAQQVRLNYQAKLGRPVTVQEVAEQTGLDRKAIARLENNKTERYDGDVLAKLCAFYGVQVGDLINYTEVESRRGPNLAVLTPSPVLLPS
jgi:DNA-binding Xre family transcriptional regulator